MPRNAAGTYSLPNSPVVTGTTIDSADENDTRDDFASEMTNSLDRGGRGAMTAALKIVDGTAASPGIQFSSDANNGFFRNGADDWSASAGSTEVANFTTTGVKVFGFKLNTLSPAQITANQNDYNPTSLSSASYLRLDTDAARDLTGLQGGVAGRCIRIHYVGSTSITLKDESASSTAAYRFALPADLVLGPDMSVDLTYDATTSRWRMQTGAVSAALQPVVNASTLAAARTTLDAARLVASLTEDTAPDKIADFIGSFDASATAEKKLRIVTALARAMPFGQGLLVNGKVSTSVGSNALTVAVKGDDGNDPSSTNPVYALFRKSTLTDSGFDIVAITGALSVVVSSGSTLGHASAIAQHIFVYLINNSGTAELAVSNLPPDYPGVFGKARLVSTTAEGGAGAADSATGVYSTTARSNVPWVCVAKMLSTQATAGTWASAMTQVDQAPFVIPTCQFSVTRSGAQTMGLGAWTKIQFNQEEYDSDGTWDAATNYRHQPNVAGVYTYCLSAGVTAINIGKQYAAGLYGNNSLMSVDTAHSSVIASVHGNVTLRVMMNGTSDFVDGRFYNGDTADQSLDTAGYTRMSGGRVINGGNT